MRFPLTFILTVVGLLSSGVDGIASVAELGSDSTMLKMSSQELFVEGSILMEEGFWHEAERVWTLATERSPKNRVYKYKHGLCLLEVAEDWQTASDVLSEAVEGSFTLKFDPFNPNQTLPPLEALLFLAEAKRRLGEFSQARTHIEKFNRKAGRKHNYAELAERMLADLDFAEAQLANPTMTEVESLNVNGSSDDSRPMLTVDGRTLFFSSNRSRSNGSNHGRRDPNTREHYDDVYRSQLLPDSTWSEPEFLNLGASYHAVVVGTDAFGESVIIQDHDGWTYELKVSSQWERGWTASVPFKLGKKQPTKGEVAFFPSQDRIIVSLQSRRGEGGFDLYESELDKRGQWGKLVSLGKEINTLGHELSPYVAADGKTLFFASNGLPSVGGYDIHRTVRNEDGSWSTPTSMGVPINSVEDEMSFVMGAKGELGYFSSRRGEGARDLNLYEARMNRPSPIEDNVLVMSVDASEEDFVAETLELRNLNTGEVVQVIDKSTQSSVYKFILPAGGEYVLERSRMTEGTDGDEVMPLAQRRISIPANAEPEIVDIAFADLFAPELEGVDSETIAGIDLPPFTGIERMVESEVEVVVDAVVQDSAIADEGDLSAAEALDADENTTWASNVLPLTIREDTGLDGMVVTQVMSTVGTNMSAPICPLDLDEDVAGDMLLAIQFYSNQVHTGRMSIEPVVSTILQLSREGKLNIRIEGSASALSTKRPRGNEGLASDRAENVRYRLTQRLEFEGLIEGTDYDLEMVKRVQPESSGLGMNAGGDNPARHQYVRVDVELR